MRNFFKGLDLTKDSQTQATSKERRPLIMQSWLTKKRPTKAITFTFFLFFAPSKEGVENIRKENFFTQKEVSQSNISNVKTKDREKLFQRFESNERFPNPGNFQRRRPLKMKSWLAKKRSCTRSRPMNEILGKPILSKFPSFLVENTRPGMDGREIWPESARSRALPKERMQKKQKSSIKPF